MIELVCLKKIALIKSGPQALWVFSVDKWLNTPSSAIVRISGCGLGPLLGNSDVTGSFVHKYRSKLSVQYLCLT